MGIVQTNLDGKVLNYFKSVKEASETLGISRSLIYGVLQGHNTKTHGFRFFDADDYCKAMDESQAEEEAIDITEDSDEFYVLIKFKSGVMVKIPTKYIDYTVTPSQLEIEI